MSKTIVIGSDFVKMDIFALNLKMYVGTETTVLESFEKLKTFIELDPSVDLILIESEIDGRPVAQEIYDYLKENKLSIQLCILGDRPKEIDTENVLPISVSIKRLIKTVAKILDVTASDMIKKKVGDYVPIPLGYFFTVDKPVCDVFVRVDKKGGGYQHVQRFEAGKVVNKQLVSKYKETGVTQLFIPSEYRLKFTDYYSEKMIDMLNSKDLTGEERIAVSSEGMNMLAEDINTVGLTDRTVEMATACLNSVKKTVHEYPKLGMLLKILTKDEGSYLYKYCQILTYVMSHIVDKSDWGSAEQKDKLTFVIFFQDIALAAKKFDTVKLQTIRTKKQFKDAKLDEFESKVVEQHAVIAANLVKDFPSAPIEADALIKQHHGSHNGMGFPENISSNSSHLTLILIIAQDFTDRIMNVSSMKDYHLGNIMESIKENYRSLKLKKLVDNLASIEF